MKNSEKLILLVEDNPDDEFLTLDAFSQNKILNPVDVVRDGAEALEYLFRTGRYSQRDAHKNPVVVLLDLNLPKVSGLDVLKRIRSDPRTRLLPVVVLTTSNEQQDLLNSYSNGCNSYTRKPVNMAEFVEAVRQLGIYWLATAAGRARSAR